MDNDLLVSHLSALSELALSAPDSFGNRSEDIIEFLTTKVINAVSPSAEVSIRRLNRPHPWTPCSC